MMHLLLGWALAAPQVEVSASNHYVGQGADGTGIVGLEDEAQLVDVYVEARFPLDPLGPDSSDPASVWRFFEDMTRDYDAYEQVSPLIRIAFGRAHQQPVSPLAFFQELSAATTDRGRPLLSNGMLLELLLDLSDSYAVRGGALSDCRADLDAWLWAVTLPTQPLDTRGVPQLQSALRSADPNHIRARIAEVEPTGCLPDGPRDYLYMSHGSAGSSEQSWVLMVYDFGTPDPNATEHFVPYRQVAGASRYFEGGFTLRIEPDALHMRYGYRVDLSLWPVKVVTRYHEQALQDFVLVFWERVVAEVEEEP